MTRTNIIFISLLILGEALLNGCAADRHVAASTLQIVRDLDVVTAQTSKMPDRLEAIGTVRAAQTSQLAAQVTGRIVAVNVHEGDRVRRGQVLVVIDDVEAKAAVDRAASGELAAQQELAAAEADFGLAESTLKRYQALFEDKVVSAQALEEIKARQQGALAHRELARAAQAQAKAALTQAHTALEYTRIPAPFNGVISERKLDPGALASPGVAILSIEDTSRYRLEAAVNETDLRYIRIGQEAPIFIDALSSADLKGRVAQIVPAADPASRSFLIKIDLAGTGEMRSGLFGHAEFSRGTKPELMIPHTAVIQRGQLQGVYVLDENKIASLRYITMGRSAGAAVEVLAGIQDGDRVVAEPGETDLSGKRIEARQ
jgi:RND family efflux transporter MFP subunit